MACRPTRRSAAPVVLRCLGLLAGAIGVALAHAAAEADWRQPFLPYRLRLELAAPARGKVRLPLQPQAVLDAFATVSIDQTDIDAFAFEKATLVDAGRGDIVGGFRLVPDGEPLAIDGRFEAIAVPARSAWRNFDPSRMRVETNDAGGRTLWITNSVFKNQRLAQTVRLVPGQFYLLNYRIYLDVEDGATQPQLIDPQLRIFNHVHHSYCPAVLPRRQWTKQSILYRPAKETAELQLFTGFRGMAAVSEIGLQPVRLALEADLAQPADRLDLYGICRGGHRLPAPTDLAQPFGDATVVAADIQTVQAQRQELNPDGAIHGTSGVTLWSIPPEYPLRGRAVAKSMPPAGRAGKALTAWVARGGQASCLVAVRTDTPRADIRAETDLPLPARIERIAEIPLFDGPAGHGRQFDVAYDAIVPLDFPFCPSSSLGTHILLITVSADARATPGMRRGNLAIAVNAGGRDTRFSIPLDVQVLAPVIEPTKHFAAMFAAHHFTVRYFKGTGPFTKDSTTVAEYHGFPSHGIEPTTVLSLTSPDATPAGAASIRDLAWKYYNRLMDFNILPQAPALFAPFGYDIAESAAGKPELSNWEFAEFDRALDEFLFRRNAPWFGVYHTNGHQMHKIRLRNGMTYSFEPAPQDVDPKTWRQLPRDDYFNLVADYFEAIAAHLDQRGLAGRAILVIDESDPSTYSLMRDYVMAIKSRPHAEKMRVLHTTYKPSTYTLHAPGGDALMLDGILDFPASDNDDHFNHFEPQANARLKQISRQWVYYVETDHFTLDQTGISTMITPLKLKKFGAEGWYCWAAFIWDMPYPKTELSGFKYPSGPVVNPWINPFYHHGNGALSFFYPPVPAGPADHPTDRIIPAYRLALIRDGIEYRALLETVLRGCDDAGNKLTVEAVNREKLDAMVHELFPDHPVQWYLSYRAIADLKARLATAAGDGPLHRPPSGSIQITR